MPVYNIYIEFERAFETQAIISDNSFQLQRGIGNKPININIHTGMPGCHCRRTLIKVISMEISNFKNYNYY